MNRNAGMLFVISSPSGGGKTTVIQSLKKMNLDLAYSISATTRPIRQGEENGKDYYFISHDVFQDHLDREEFIEFAEVHGNYYGTFRRQIDSYLNDGKSVVLDVDVQGAVAIKKLYPKAVLIFLLPPSIKVLEERLRKRGTENEDVVQRRLETAKAELEMADEYDFQIINKDLNATMKKIVAIIDTCQKENN